MKWMSLRSSLSGTAFALCVMTAVSAGTLCTQPKDEIALKTADLQQFLMVAALTCHEAGAYNDFVRSHQSELQASDHKLLAYFMAQNAVTGDADYNAFKTWLANAASMKSLRDPYFCRAADASFGAAQDGTVARLVSQQPPPIRLSYVSCNARGPVEEADDDDTAPPDPWRDR
ncbi:MAG: hypothetical protein KGJ78_17410 [Alphaproteobacteria bacterium]|nr:hypothetical protein [Alphaproteobacteria bacterium]